ncbi:MAG: monofunctional biosynthetic peptidoglycan transglycosylase, partial [Rhizobium sp.]
AGITLLIENIWGKDRILEMYLNIAEFGPGIYGVEAASQAYFHKSAAKLTPNEAARLAAVLPSPRRWKVTAPGAYVQKRVSWIMGQMGYGHGPSEEPEPPSMGPESGGQLNDADDSSVIESAPSTPVPVETMPGEAAPAEESAPVTPAPEPASTPAQAPPATTP